MELYILYSSIAKPLLSLPCSSTKKIRAYIISNLKKYIKDFCNSFVSIFRSRIHSDSNEKTTSPASSEKFYEKFSIKILPALSEKLASLTSEENNLSGKPNLSNFTLNSHSRDSTVSLDSTSSQSTSTSTYSQSSIYSQDSASSQMITILPDEMKPIF